MESCGMSTVKYILFIFNVIFAISGLGIIIAGALVLADVHAYSHFLEGRIIAPPIVLIVAGAIVFVIAFLGCYGAIKEHYNLLIGFAVALLIIFIIELAVGIAAAVFKKDFSDGMKDALRESMRNYKEKEVDQQAWDTIQMRFSCCGIDAPTDWLREAGITNGLPASCCVDTTVRTCANNAEAYQRGCFSELVMNVEKNASVLIGVGIGIAFVEVAGILLACLLAYVIKKENQGK
ncbi:CD63 antigen [Phymastichus coffea]|uniref:CD63 antigen n=1 Tax=Phymastichus coffea TaxID=108790 RepID=UPI00273AF25A|nr:CD63 antigen [Phymastichus coffea]